MDEEFEEYFSRMICSGEDCLFATRDAQGVHYRFETRTEYPPMMRLMFLYDVFLRGLNGRPMSDSKLQEIRESQPVNESLESFLPSPDRVLEVAESPEDVELELLTSTQLEAKLQSKKDPFLFLVSFRLEEGLGARVFTNTGNMLSMVGLLVLACRAYGEHHTVEGD